MYSFGISLLKLATGEVVEGPDSSYVKQVIDDANLADFISQCTHR